MIGANIATGAGSTRPPSGGGEEPGGESFVVHAIDLSGGTLFGYHNAIGGSVTGEPDPEMTFNWFYSNPADRLNIQIAEGLLPVLEGLTLVRDGVGEMPLQGHTSSVGTTTSITLPNLSEGLGITEAGDFSFHFEPFERTGPLQVSGRQNGNAVEWATGATSADEHKQGAEYDNTHPLQFVRVNAVDGGGSFEIQWYGDTLALLAGKHVTINGQAYAFDDATTSDYNSSFTDRTYYLWEATGSEALTPATFYTVAIADAP